LALETASRKKYIIVAF